MNGGAVQHLITAEIHLGRDRDAIVWIGNRAVHQFWTVMAPFFRDILLPPHRRPDDEVVAWSWRVAGERRTPTGGELAALRKRLAGDQRAFADHVRDEAATGSGPANLRQLAGAVEQIVARLLELPDGELAAFVACTESGLRLHSWGATRPADTTSPDQRKHAPEAATNEDGKPAQTERRRRTPAIWWTVAAVAVLGVAGWKWRQIHLEKEITPAGAAAATKNKLFEPGRASAEFGERDKATPQAGLPAQSGLGTATVARSETSGGTSGTVTSSGVVGVAGRAVIEEFESKRATPKPVLGPPDATLAGAGDSAGISAGASVGTGEIAVGAGGVGEGASALNAGADRGTVRAVPGEEGETSRVQAALATAEARRVEADRRAVEAGRRKSRETKERATEQRADRPVAAPTKKDDTLVASTFGHSKSWPVVVRVSATRWNVRLLADAIVPTEPMRVGAAGGIAEARERTMAEWRERLPVAFAEVRGRRGYVIECAGAAVRWRASFDQDGVVTSAEGRRAEISWNEGGTGVARLLELVDAEDRTVAIVETEPGTDGMLRVADGVRASFWISVEQAGADFVWRRRGETIGRGSRLDLPLYGVAANGLADNVTLFDAASGWAIERRITIAPMAAR